jgi:hypothetical protein
VCLFSDFILNFYIIFYLFGLCLATSWSPYSLKPHTLGSPPRGMGYEGVDCSDDFRESLDDNEKRKKNLDAWSFYQRLRWKHFLYILWK